MKIIRLKTKKEREEPLSYEKIKVKETRYYFWVCEKCKIAYFDKDIVLKYSDGSMRCPNDILSCVWFSLRKLRLRTCNETIRGGDKECFEKYFKVVEDHPDSCMPSLHLV